MSKTVINNNSGKLGFCSILTLVFVVAKILGYLDWSWLWVFSPLWLPLGSILAFILVLSLFIGAIELYERHEKAKRKKARG